MKQLSKSHRILFLDDNIRDLGGHYLELASLLCQGADQLGYSPELITNRALSAELGDSPTDSRLSALAVTAGFSVRRMERWSLGVDGGSRLPRQLDGRIFGASLHERFIQLSKEIACRPSRRPQRMLRSWADTFVEAVRGFEPQLQDHIVVNTGSDFQMLALAGA